ncbi:MAG: GNAT family N-acetyltransferase [Verrucomicrobiae bacterium]|nr:GNAT family N-acetyltransferase [Verrucomicrobiae bacterium]
MASRPDLPTDQNLSLLDSGLFDSFSFIQLLNQIEREFSVTIDFASYPPEELTSLQGLATIVEEAVVDFVEGNSGSGPDSNSSVPRETFLLEPSHPNWPELADLFRNMYEEFRELGLQLPLRQGGESTWLSNLEKSSSALSPVVGICDGNDELVGFAQGAVKFLPAYLEGQTAGEVLYLYVAPDARNLGLGRALANSLISKLWDGKVHSVELKVISGNIAAQAFWKSLGFREEIIQYRMLERESNPLTE